MCWLLKTVSYEDYINRPQDYILKIIPHGENEIIKKPFLPDPQGNLLIKEVVKPTPEKLGSNEIRIIFNSLKAEAHKHIDEKMVEINDRIEKIEKQVETIHTKQAIKLPRLILGLIALASFLFPFSSLHEPKIELPKIQMPKPAPKPKVYYRPAPKQEVFTPVYKLIKLFQDLIKPR